MNIFLDKRYYKKPRNFSIAKIYGRFSFFLQLTFRGIQKL